MTGGVSYYLSKSPQRSLVHKPRENKDPDPQKTYYLFILQFQIEGLSHRTSGPNFSVGVGNINNLVPGNLGLSLGNKALNSSFPVQNVSDILVLFGDLVKLGDQFLVLDAKSPDILFVFFDVHFELVVVIADLVEHDCDLLELSSDILGFVHLGSNGG